MVKHTKPENYLAQSNFLVVFFQKKDDEPKLIVFIYLLVLKAKIKLRYQ